MGNSYEDQKVPELREEVKRRELDVKSDATKDELVAALKESDKQGNDVDPVHESAREATDVEAGAPESHGSIEEDVDGPGGTQQAEAERVASERQEALPLETGGGLPSEVGPENEIKPGEPGPNPARSAPVNAQAKMATLEED